MGRNNGKPAYICTPHLEGCGRLAVVAEPVESIITEAVLRVFDTPALAAHAEEPSSESGERLATLEARKADLAEAFAAGEIDRAQLAAATRRLDAEVGEVKRMLVVDAGAALLAPYRDKTGMLRERWSDLSEETRRSIIGAVVQNVTVAPNAVRGRHTFDPERLSIVWRA
jgi:hypothetical protein